LLERLDDSPGASRIFLSRRLRDCHPSFHVAKPAGVCGGGGFRGDEPVLELAYVVRCPQSTGPAPGPGSGSAARGRLRGPGWGKIVDAEAVVCLGRCSRPARGRADARQAHRVQVGLEPSSGVEPTELRPRSHAHAHARRGRAGHGWRCRPGRGDVSGGRRHLARQEQARRLRSSFAASGSGGRRYVIGRSCA